MKIFIEMQDWTPIAQFLAQLPTSNLNFHFIIDEDEDEMQAYTYRDGNAITIAICKHEEDGFLVLGHECVHLLQHFLGLPVCEEQAYKLETLACGCLLGKYSVKTLIQRMERCKPPALFLS